MPLPVKAEVLKQGDIKPRTREGFITPAWACAKHHRSVHIATGNCVCYEFHIYTPSQTKQQRLGAGRSLLGGFERVRTPCREWRCQTM